MKREILFRGKRVDNNEWVEGALWDKCSSGCTIISGDGTDRDCFAFVDLETVGQFTGLTDKNGVKIFEGDIVKTDSGAIQKVEYRSDMAMFVLRFNKGASTGLTSKCEVIGNIHDNPELLKQD